MGELGPAEHYTYTVRQSKDGEWEAVCVELPQVSFSTNTGAREALFNVIMAVSYELEALERRGEPIPKPGSVPNLAEDLKVIFAALQPPCSFCGAPATRHHPRFEAGSRLVAKKVPCCDDHLVEVDVAADPKDLPYAAALRRLQRLAGGAS